jgi:glycosyltransferase involved in cell wall biosynthesis
MHILQVLQDLGYGSTGPRVTVNFFNKAFRDLGHTVQAISFDRVNHPPEARPPGTLSVPVLQLPMLRHYVLSAKAAMGHYDDQIAAADVVFIHNLYGHNFTWAANRIKKHPKPCFVVPHGSLTDFCLSRGALKKRLWFASVRSFMENNVCMVFSAEYEQEQALHYVHPARTTVLYWPASALPEPSQAQAPEIQDRPTLLLFGRLHPMKRTLETVTSFRRVRSGKWRLCLAGPESPEVSLNDLKRAAGDDWGDSVLYLGSLRQEELSPWYRWASGVVLFSKGDNFSHVVAEGLLAGCPAYVSQDVGLASLVEKRGCGRMVRIENDADIERGLSEAMRELSNDQTRPCSRHIHEVASAELSYSAFTLKVRGMLEEAFK